MMGFDQDDGSTEFYPMLRRKVWLAGILSVRLAKEKIHYLSNEGLMITRNRNIESPVWRNACHL